MVYPDNTMVNLNYDSLHRLISIPGFAQFTYNSNSLIETMNYENNTLTTYQYDNCNRPEIIQTRHNNTDLMSLQYHYDSAGNVTQLNYNRIHNQNWKESTEIFSYDWIDRLISAQGDYGQLLFSYDEVGNRTTLNDLQYTYNNMNELLSINEEIFFTYDENGNTLSKTEENAVWKYSYDMRNLLVEIEKNQEIIAQYRYDGDGKRIKKTEWIESLQDYQTIIFVYSGSQVVYEKNVDTDQEAIYIYGPTGKIMKKVGELKDYYHSDYLGSTRLITDESGQAIKDVQYNPFGITNEEEEKYLFTGKEKDNSGLSYFGARYYDPQIGRFITRDSYTGDINIPQSLNRYIYCKNNPLRYIDPAGNSSISNYSSNIKQLNFNAGGYMKANFPFLHGIFKYGI